MSSRFHIYQPQVIHETIQGETVIINLETGAYYSLDGAGAEVWNLIVAGADRSVVIECLEGRYEGAPGQVEGAVNSLLAELEREGLIRPEANGHVAETPTAPLPQTAPAASQERVPLRVPRLNKYTDMEYLLLLDPIHEVDEGGWPQPAPAA